MCTNTQNTGGGAVPWNTVNTFAHAGPRNSTLGVPPSFRWKWTSSGNNAIFNSPAHHDTASPLRGQSMDCGFIQLQAAHSAAHKWCRAARTKTLITAVLSPNREDYLFNLLRRICLGSAQFSATISTGKYSRYLSICFSPADINWESSCVCMCVCVNTGVCRCVAFCGMCRCHVGQTGRAAKCGATKGPAEKEPSTRCSQSSLLAIYNVLHYITIPLALGHLHIPVTSSQRLLIINGSHMLRSVPHCRVIGVTQKRQEKWKLSRHKTKHKNQSEDLLLLIVSQPRWLNGYLLHPRDVGPRWHLWAEAQFADFNFSDNFFVYANELDSDWLLYKVATLTKHSLSIEQTK